MRTMQADKISSYMSFLNRFRNRLTKQQYRTLKGQILKGDYEGAIKGLERLMNRRRKNV